MVRRSELQKSLHKQFNVSNERDSSPGLMLYLKGFVSMACRLSFKAVGSTPEKGFCHAQLLGACRICQMDSFGLEIHAAVCGVT